MFTDDMNEFSKQMKTRLDAFGRTTKLSPAKRLASKGKFLRKAQRSVIEPEYFQRKVASGFGVLSLSETHKNILMWSHYAQNHKGYLLKLLSPINGSVDDAAITNEGGFNRNRTATTSFI